MFNFRKSLAFLVVLFGLSTIFAEQAKIQGIVVSGSADTALPYADITIFDYQTDTVIATAKGDDFGHFFTLGLPQVSSGYAIKVAVSSFPDQYWHPDNNTSVKPNFEVKIDSGEIFTVKIMMNTAPNTTEPYPLFFPGTITGQVRNADTAVSGLELQLIDVEAQLSLGKVVSNRNGEFFFFNVDPNRRFNLKAIPGKGVLDGYPAQYYDAAQSSINPHVELSVRQFTTNSVGNFNISLYPDTSTNNGIIDNNGQLSIRGTVKNSSGVPLKNAKVGIINTANLHNGYYLSFPYFPSDREGYTDSTGNYEIYDLPSGKYFAVSLVENENYIPNFYPSSTTLDNADTITIISTSTPQDINFTLNAGEIVRGFIVDTSGTGIEGLEIDLELNSSDMGGVTISHQAESDSYGKFELVGIPSGFWRAHIWDESSLYIMKDFNDEVIETDGIGITEFSKNFVMQLSGFIKGFVTGVGTTDTTNNFHSYGRIFPISENFKGYPQFDTSYYDNFDKNKDAMDTSDMSTFTPTPEEDALYSWIEIRSDSSNSYKSSGITPGNMRFVFAPEPDIDFMNFANSGKSLVPSKRWTFFDNSTSLASSKVFNIAAGVPVQHNFEIKAGGYSLLFNIVADKPDTSYYRSNNRFSDTDTSSQIYNYQQIMAFIKEDGVMLKVAESFDIGNNKYILSGLVPGENYYLMVASSMFPYQWWADSANFSTGNQYNAKPFTFNPTTYSPVTLYLKNNPEGSEKFDDNHFDQAVANQKMTTIGLKAVEVSWSPLPDSFNIVSYKVFKIEGTSSQELKDLFVLGEHGYEPINEESLSGMLDSVVVTKNSYIDTKVEYGKSYMYVIVPIDAKGREGNPLPVGVSLDNYITKINFSAFVKNQIIKPKTWQMIAVPGTEGYSLTYDSSSDMALFYWDEDADSTGLYSKYVLTKKVSPKNGYWIYSANTLTPSISDSSIGKLYKLLGNIKDTMKVGWNQISSPFPYPVSPEFISSTSPAYEYDSDIGGYKMVEKSLKPWKGYWFYSNKEMVINYSELPAVATPKRRSALSRSKMWDIKLSLIGKNNSDMDNYVGLVSNNSRGAITTVEPPIAFGAPSLYIEENSVRYSKSYKTALSHNSEKSEWKIALSPSDASMALRFSNLGSVPENIKIFWINDGKVQEITSDSEVKIEPHSNTQYGYLAAVEDQAAIAFYSGKFTFRQNYPNPFRGTTTFEFVLPYSYSSNGEKNSNGTFSVSLDIYSMNGKKVATVFSKPFSVGVHKEIWRATSISAGVYIARLKSPNFTKTIKLYKLK